MKIWLDDLRPAPNDSWTYTKDYEETIQLLKQLMLEGQEIEVASLDHDLGGQAYNYCANCRTKDLTYEEWHALFVHGCEHGPKVGRCVVEWMERHNFWPKRIIIHSHNTEGAQRMAEIAAPYTKVLVQPYTGQEI